MIKNLKLLPLIIFLFTAVCFSQEKQTVEQKKVALILESQIFDKQQGIKDFAFLHNLVDSNRNAIKQVESNDNQKIENSVYNPAKEDFSDLLNLIEIQHNLFIVRIDELDVNGLILGFNPKFDVTRKIISFTNNKSSKSVANLKFDIQESKIATINTSIFYDQQKGINNLIKLKSKYQTRQELCSKTPVCLEIGNFIQNFGIKKGYSVIFDSGKEIPAKIRQLQMADITTEFIAEYNKSNK